MNKVYSQRRSCFKQIEHLSCHPLPYPNLLECRCGLTSLHQTRGRLSFLRSFAPKSPKALRRNHPTVVKLLSLRVGHTELIRTHCSVPSGNLSRSFILPVVSMAAFSRLEVLRDCSFISTSLANSFSRSASVSACEVVWEA